MVPCNDSESLPLRAETARAIGDIDSNVNVSANQSYFKKRRTALNMSGCTSLNVSHHGQGAGHRGGSDQEATLPGTTSQSGIPVDELQQLRDELHQAREALAQEQRYQRLIEDERFRLGCQNVDYYIALKRPISSLEH